MTADSFVLFPILGENIQSFASKYISYRFYVNALYQVKEILSYS